MKKMQKPRQLELGLKLRVADLQFFKMFSAAIVHHGLISKLGASAFAVLVTMKANSRPSDGRIYIGTLDLAEQTGLSENTVRSSLKKLIELGYIEQKTEAANKKKHYYVFDEFHFRRLYEGETETDALDQLHAGNGDGLVRVRYSPMQNRDDLNEIEQFMHGGSPPSRGQVVMVERQLVGQQQVNQQLVQQQMVINAAPGSVVVVAADGSARIQDQNEVNRQRIHELIDRYK